MTLRIESGDPITCDVAVLPGDTVRFVTDDGRTMYSVYIDRDGVSLGIRGVHFTKHGDKVYSDCLLVRPVACNGINVSAELHSNNGVPV